MSPDGLFIMVHDRYVRICLSGILYVQAKGDEVRIVFTEGELESGTRLEQWLAVLPPKDFCQVHSAYIVATGKVQDFSETHIGLPGMDIPLEKRFRQSFFNRYTFLFEMVERESASSYFINDVGELRFR